MNKDDSLIKLRDRIQSDSSLPLREGAHHMVFGEGNPNTEVIFIGEAPGKTEDLTGKPFSGAAGKLLDKLLTSINLSRNECYITNVVKFRPPGNRTPTPEEIEIYSVFLKEQIEIIHPKLIVTLGRVPLSLFLQNVKISQAQGILQQINYMGNKINLLPMYHPAAALRNGYMMERLKESFQKIKHLLSKI